MAKKQVIKQGILSLPVNTNYIVQVNRKGVITICKANLTNVKRPNQYKSSI
jgi:hypothetical protein